MNVRENLTFEDVHDEVCRLWHLPHDRFKIVVNISDTLNLWRQYEFPPANKVQETLLELGNNEELGFGNFGLSRRTPQFLPPVFLVYQPFQARLTGARGEGREGGRRAHPRPRRHHKAARTHGPNISQV